MSFNLNPTGLFPGPSGSGIESTNSHPYTFLDEGGTITLGTGESGMYIPLSNISDHFNMEYANEKGGASDYRYLVWAITDQATEYQASMEEEPAGVQLIKGPLFGEGDGVTQLYKQKYYFDGSVLKLRSAEDNPFN